MNIKGTGDKRFDQVLCKLRRALVGLEGTDVHVDLLGDIAERAEVWISNTAESW